MSDPMADWPVIFSYTRADAIRDGVLVAVVGDVARLHGFNCPVAISQAVHHDLVAWSNHDSAVVGNRFQTESGRLHDLLAMANFAIIERHRRDGAHVDRVPISMSVVPRPGSKQFGGQGPGHSSAIVVLPAQRAIAHIGLGDAGEPVLTIMYPEDD